MMFLVDERVDEKKHPIRPEYINAKEHFWDAFGNNETEISAGWIVRLCQEVGGWKPFTYEQIEELYSRSKKHQGFGFNSLLSKHFVVKSGDMYFVSHAFICRCFASSPTRELVSPKAVS